MVKRSKAKGWEGASAGGMGGGREEGGDVAVFLLGRLPRITELRLPPAGSAIYASPVLDSGNMESCGGVHY